MSQRITFSDIELRVMRVALGTVGEDLDSFGLTDEEKEAYQALTSKLRAKRDKPKREPVADEPKGLMIGTGKRKIAVEPPFPFEKDAYYVFDLDWVRGTAKIEQVTQEEYHRAWEAGRQTMRAHDTFTINEIIG